MTARIKVIGVGGGGGNAVRNMLTSELRGVEFICANTDVQALMRIPEVVKRVQIGEKLTKGLGAGADPQIGNAAANESISAIKEAIGEADMIFVTAGMGGGTGTGAAPVVAQMAKGMGILTVGVVTRPFLYEGDKRLKMAEQGIAELREHVDSLIIIPNERLLRLAPKNAKLVDMFRQADNVLYAAVRGISDLIMIPGHINLDFADMRTAMAESGFAMMGSGRASGEGRAIEAARMAINSPLLEDMSIAGAKAVLINVTATSDMSMTEYAEAMELLHGAAHSASGDGHIIAGMAFDEDAGDEMRITVIATGIDTVSHIPAVPKPGARVHTLHSSQGAAQTASQTKAAAGEGKRRPYTVPGEDECLDIPPTVRNLARGHRPGEEELRYGPEEDDLPIFIRKQAN